MHCQFVWVLVAVDALGRAGCSGACSHLLHYQNKAPSLASAVDERIALMIALLTRTGALNGGGWASSEGAVSPMLVEREK